MKTGNILTLTFSAGILITGVLTDKPDENASEYVKDIMAAIEASGDKLVDFLKKYGEKITDGVKNIDPEELKEQITDTIGDDLDKLKDKFNKDNQEIVVDVDDVKTKLSDSFGDDLDNLKEKIGQADFDELSDAVKTFLDENTNVTGKGGFIKVKLPNITDIKSQMTDKMGGSFEDMMKEIINLADKFSLDVVNVFDDMKSKLGGFTDKFDESKNKITQIAGDFKIDLGDKAGALGSDFGKKTSEMKSQLDDKKSGMKNKLGNTASDLKDNFSSKFGNRGN